jgi:hypothetical protein
MDEEITVTKVAGILAKLVHEDAITRDGENGTALRRMSGCSPGGIPFSVVVAIGEEPVAALEEWLTDKADAGWIIPVREQ